MGSFWTFNRIRVICDQSALFNGKMLHCSCLSRLRNGRQYHILTAVTLSLPYQPSAVCDQARHMQLFWVMWGLFLECVKAASSRSEIRDTKHAVVQTVGSADSD